MIKETETNKEQIKQTSQTTRISKNENIKAIAIIDNNTPTSNDQIKSSEKQNEAIKNQKQKENELEKEQKEKEKKEEMEKLQKNIKGEINEVNIRELSNFMKNRLNEQSGKKYMGKIRS